MYNILYLITYILSIHVICIIKYYMYTSNIYHIYIYSMKNIYYIKLFITYYQYICVIQYYMCTSNVYYIYIFYV